MKHLFGLVVCCTVGAWMLNACTPTDDAMGVPEASEEVIALQPVLVEQTRVQLFEPSTNNNFYDKDKGGGEFNVNAYYDGTALKYISNGRVWYREEDKNWINLAEDDKVTDYYWPNVGALNFFAYMPSTKFMTDTETYVTIGNYTHDAGQQFSCKLPYSNADYDNMQEFIYAYAPKEEKTSGKVKLTFVHPFSLVCFQLGSGSIRMTVESIVLGNIYLNGTFSTGQISTVGGIGTWTPTGSASTYTATIGKRIPNEVNYNTIFGGPFVMMPQDLGSVSLTLKYKREDAGSGSETKTVNSLKTTDISKWEPGKRYIYTLSHGDNKEEIYFNVKVVDWDVVDYRNEIDVE